MEQKNKILDYLHSEHQRLTARRDEVMAKVDTERDEYEEDNPNPILEECVAELQSLVEHIFDIENIIRTLKSNFNQPRKKGEPIKIGDVVTLKSPAEQRQYYISHSSDYVNPGMGIISPNSPIGQAILGCKIGETIVLPYDGNQAVYELAP